MRMSQWAHQRATSGSKTKTEVSGASTAASLEACDMGVEWQSTTGFNSRRMECFAFIGKHKLEIHHSERVDSVWRPSKYFHAYVDGKWVGHHRTVSGAKLACILSLSHTEDQHEGHTQHE